MNLLQSIPVYKPQNAVVKNNNTPTFTPAYQYIPARPLNEPNTSPLGIKPQSPTGYLVRENIFQSAGSTIKSYGKYAKYFYDAAFKGEGTDYSVGKINDLAIRTGSLGIAAVLASSKIFPMAKGMEFVGLATWFASMAIWPRVIGTPIKAAHGVDINQKYVDSYGRRKSFFEDPQYLPWDLYRHIDKQGKYNEKAPDYEYLDKIGDKLNIPRNIENRHEEIHNKMKQIAIQSNSLWMLTAGVMTPIISSVVADKLQEPIKDGLEKIRYKKQENALSELGKKLDSILSKKVDKLEDVMSELNIKADKTAKTEFDKLNKEAMTTPEFTKLKNFMEKRFFGTGIYEAMEKEMNTTLNMDASYIKTSPKFKEDMMKLSEEVVNEVKNMLPKEIQETLPNELKAYKGLSLERVEKAIYDSFYSQSGELDDVAHNSLRNKIGRYLKQDLEKINGIEEEFVDEALSSINKKAKVYFDENKYFKSPVQKMEEMFKFAETNLQLKMKVRKFEETCIRDISESKTANNWGKIPQKYLNTLGFNKNEIAQLAMTDSSFSSKIIAKKFEEIANDPTKYEKVIKEMSKYAKEAVTKEEMAVIELVGTSEKPGVLSKIKTLMENISRKHFSNEMTEPLAKYYYNKINDIENKLRNTTDSFARPIKALDSFKDIEQTVINILGENKDIYNNKISTDITSKKGLLYTFHNTSYEEAKTSLTRYIKDIVLEKNDINNWTTKFETTVGNTKKGVNHSFWMINEIANKVNGTFSKETAELMGEDLAKKLNINNTVMKFRFLGMDNKLWSHANEPHPSWNLLKDFIDKKELGNYETLLGLVEARKSELLPNEVQDCKNKLKEIAETIKRGYKYDISDAELSEGLAKHLNFKTKSKPMAEMSGKNVTDFFTRAAENNRGRNKWSKLAYGLLIGTTAFTAVVMALIGRKNHFNKGIQEKAKNDNK